MYAWQEEEGIAGVAVANMDGDTLVLNYLDAKPHSVRDLLAAILCAHEAKYLTAAVPVDIYQEAKPLLEKVVARHQPDQWLVMVKEVSPLATSRD